MGRPIGERVWSRRRVLAAGGAGLVGTAAAAGPGPAWARQPPPALEAQQADLARDVVVTFSQLPGRKALKLWAPADTRLPEWSATLNANTLLLVASVIKVFILAEYLRQAEARLDPGAAVPLRQQLDSQLAEEWTLDASVFSPTSPVFNPPNLTGKVTARTALEAMMAWSDNTATDMVLAQVGADAVRSFIASIGMRNTRIPTSTLQFVSYILGLPNWQSLTWASFQALIEAQPDHAPRPLVNDECTMASTPDDMVSFYSRALHGEFFRYPESLAVFRAILRLASPIPELFPLGVTAFLKGGSIDIQPLADRGLMNPDESGHAVAVAGGLYLPKPNRWVYYALTYNWTDADGAPGEQAYVDNLQRILALIHERLPG